MLTKKVKEIIFPIAEKLYDNEEMLNEWKNIIDTSKTTKEMQSKSFALATLYIYVETTLEDGLTPETIMERLEDHTYLEKLKSMINEYEIIEKHTKNIDKEKIIERLIAKESVETGNALFYHRMREAISMNMFVEVENDVPTYTVQDGPNKHVAKLLTDVEKGRQFNNGDATQWENLMTDKITAMDDYTADTFDIVTILWMNTAKDIHDSINFSHEDILRFRDIQKTKSGSGNLTFRKKDRKEAMGRLAALASIWVSPYEDKDVSTLESMEENKDIKLTKLRPLFQLDNVTFAHDRTTNKPIGIYSCDIKPTDLLVQYLDGPNKKTSILSMKALQYSPDKQKYHKRLARYLSWQWKIRSRSGEYTKPFKLGGDSGLVKAIGFELDEKRPTRTVDKFEAVLDALTADKVIGGWRYEEIDENKKQGRGWLITYWLKLKVIIDAPEDLKKEYLTIEQIDTDILNINQVRNLVKQLNSTPSEIINELPMPIMPDVSEYELEVNPDNVKKVRIAKELTIFNAAKEIGISHTTLSRYEQGKIKKPNSKNTELLKTWLSSYYER